MARAPKLDQICADAVGQAREAAAEAALEPIGEYLGCTAEADRVVTHRFAAGHPGYRGWQWNVTMVRASRARRATVNEVVVLPGPDAVVATAWVPWSDRAEPADLEPGMLAPTPDSDPRLEPGFTGGDAAADTDPAEVSQMRAIVAELGLGRERVMSPYGREVAATRWRSGDGGPNDQMTRHAPGICVTCAYFVRLTGSLGTVFGACANGQTPFDGRVVSVDHGCGGHSNVVDETRAAERAPVVWDTIIEPDELFS